MVGDVFVFDRFARLYDLFAPGTDSEELARGLGRAERPIERVLDVGGGPGRALGAIEANLGVVVDPARGMVNRARVSGKSAVLADGAALPVRTNSVDAVVVTDALHHVGHQKGLLAEAARVLRPGGVLVIIEFDPTTIRGRLLVAAEHAVGLESEFSSPSELAGMIESAGLTPEVLREGFGYTIAAVASDVEGEHSVPIDTKERLEQPVDS